MAAAEARWREKKANPSALHRKGTGRLADRN
jgi:hypothetical protein